MLEHRARWEHFVYLLFSATSYGDLMRLGANPPSVGLIAICLSLNSPRICVCVSLISFFLQQSFAVLLSGSVLSLQVAQSRALTCVWAAELREHHVSLICIEVLLCSAGAVLLSPPADWGVLPAVLKPLLPCSETQKAAGSCDWIWDAGTYLNLPGLMDRTKPQRWFGRRSSSEAVGG